MLFRSGYVGAVLIVVAILIAERGTHSGREAAPDPGAG